MFFLCLVVTIIPVPLNCAQCFSSGPQAVFGYFREKGGSQWPYYMHRGNEYLK